MLLGLLQPRSPWRAMSKPTVGLVVRKRRSAACPNPLLPRYTVDWDTS